MKQNKLIAEFMGYKLMSCNRGKAWDIGKSISSKDHLFPIQGVLHTGNELKFHTSWDWLMPVLKKINSEISPNTRGLWRMIINPTEYDIENVYSQAVYFINQYNK
jgi:hypothetical protein